MRGPAGLSRGSLGGSTTRAGIPTASDRSGMSTRTTLLAPMMHYSPMAVPRRTAAWSS